MSGQGHGFFRGLSGTTTTATMLFHVKANSVPMSATSTSSGQPSVTSIGGDPLKKPHILFETPPDLVYDAKTHPPNDTTVFKMPFTLLTEGLTVKRLGWYVQSDPAVSNLDPMHLAVVPDQTWRQVYQEPGTGTRREIFARVQTFIDERGSLLGKPIVFGIDWAVADQLGTTYSPAFAIVKDGDKAVQQAHDNLDQSKYKNGIEKNQMDNSEITGTGQSAAVTIIIESSTPSTPSTTVSAATSTPSLGLNTQGKVAGQGGGGGLSTGAVAGIAVGVGLAALLAAALAIFLFLRRRRRRGHGHGQATASSASDSAAALELEHKRAEMENLRANGAAAAAAAGPADAPYRDDNTTITAAAATTQQERRRSSVAPKQLPATPPSRSSTEVRAQGVSRHLVEEGMTEAEIRRLEAEEAHLDDEIQRATAARR